MRTLASRALLALPVLIVLGHTDQVRAQANAWGVGVGVGYGYGPYWGGPGFGPVWGFYPTHYHGFYGSGLSMYGPPVPTGKPIPGVFGGGDSTFFDLPPIYPGWLHQGYAPCAGPAALPPGVIGRVVELPPPAPVLDHPAPLEVEVRLPRADARLFIDGAEVKGSGAVRHFRTPPVPTAQAFSYDLRAEWTADGLTTTHAKRVLGRAGEKVVADFAR